LLLAILSSKSPFCYRKMVQRMLLAFEFAWQSKISMNSHERWTVKSRYLVGNNWISRMSESFFCNFTYELIIYDFRHIFMG
jgi:hypothetical protein